MAGSGLSFHRVRHLACGLATYSTLKAMGAGSEVYSASVPYLSVGSIDPENSSNLCADLSLLLVVEDQRLHGVLVLGLMS